MRRPAYLTVPAALLLAACDSGGSTNQVTAATNDPAPTAAEQSQDIADGRVDFQRVSYPGSEISRNPVRFTTSAPIDQVMQWYRDDARRAEGLMVSSERNDAGYLALGTLMADDSGKSFTLQISSTPAGGTQGTFHRADWLTTGQKLSNATEIQN